MRPRPICTHPGCATCRGIVVALIAQQLATVPEELRAGVAVEALRMAKAPAATTRMAAVVEAQIG